MNCSKCGRVIEDEPELGERQGGPREIVHMATTWKLNVCSTCGAPLFDLFEAHVDTVLPTGTVAGLERLKYLPRVSEDSEDPAGAGSS